MGIRLVEGHGKKRFADLDDREINRIIRSLWSN